MCVVVVVVVADAVVMVETGRGRVLLEREKSSTKRSRNWSLSSRKWAAREESKAIVRCLSSAMPRRHFCS